MVNWASLTCFLYVTARMSGFILFNPIFGRNSIPAIYRTGLVLVLSYTVYSLSPNTVNVPSTTIELILRIVLELGLGVAIAFIIQFFLYIPQLAGEVIDLQMGMSMNQIYDPGAQANLSVSGILLNTLLLLLFFAANGHVTLLRLLMTTGDILPYGAASFGADTASYLLTLFAECTVLAVKLCLPILAAELLGQLGMGVLMKMIPQINVFSINIELKVLIGLLLLLLLIAPFSEYLLDVETRMLSAVEQALHTVA